ncbi:MAG: DUF1501 domain-containing protein [Planctomycetota bacterium]|nr:DUF1501 domain-containing protein [Planctomycetota bacterium]
MDLHNANAFTRRVFLQRGVALASAVTTIPTFLNSSAWAMAQAAGAGHDLAGVPEDHVLVVIQLGGGNDGLNTVVPFRDDDYYRARPAIGIRQENVLALEKGVDVGLHPALALVKELYDEGLVSVVQGVGYPNPNRSHFKSMDIWHTADTSGVGEGWLGRYHDNECAGTPADEPQPAPTIAIGREAPLALQGRTSKPVAFESPSLFQWTGKEAHASLDEPYEAITRAGVRAGVDEESNAAFLMRTTLDAQLASDAIRKAVSQRPLVEYPRSGLARQLAMVGSMIRAGLRTRVYYVTLGGFDTHAGQGGAQGRHAQLLRQYAEALRAFHNDLQAQGNDGRVLTMTFSEFGRRVSQNGSNGTDHGTAAPMLLSGPMVRPGVLGSHPSLTDLDEGDLKFKVDFRSVYAGILADWMGANAEESLGGSFRPAKIVRT